MREMSAARAAPAPRAASEEPVPSLSRGADDSGSSGFWTFIVAAVLVMFVIYLATKPGDRLTYWINLLSWKTPAKTIYKIPGEHVSGEVNSDAPAGEQYKDQPKGGDVRKEEDSFGPIFGGILRWWQGGGSK
jgi:hypothetical protein